MSPSASDWPVLRLDQVVTLQRGFDLPLRQRRPGPWAVLGANGPVGLNDHAPVKGPGVVLGRATNLGRPTWWPADFWPLNTTLYVKDFHGNDRRFIYYLFDGMDLSGFDSGSVQPMLNRNNVAAVPVAIPPIRDQRAIADILGALDDKIESNRRLVDVSRDLARWELQHAAHGGAVVRVGDVADVGRGLAYTSAGLTGDGIPMIGLANAENFGWLKRSGLKPYFGPHKDWHVVEGESLLVTSVEQTWSNEILGWPMLVPDDLAGALFTQDLYVIRFGPGEAWRTLPVWAAMFSPGSRAWLEGHVYGSTVARIPREAIEGLRVPFPPVDHPAIDIGRSLLQRAWSAEVESQTLAPLRDALLPELLSGRLRVPEARERVEAVV